MSNTRNLGVLNSFLKAILLKNDVSIPFQNSRWPPTHIEKKLKSHITPGIIINEKTTRTNHTSVTHSSKEIPVPFITVQEVEG